MKKILLLFIILIILSSCAVMFKTIEISSKSSRKTKSFGYMKGRESYVIIFGGSADSAFPPDSWSRNVYTPDNPNDLYIFIDTPKSKLDKFPIKPKTINKIHENGKEILIYKYVAYKSLVEHAIVYISNGMVIKIKGVFFNK